METRRVSLRAVHFSLWLIVFLHTTTVIAAPCCGGGSTRSPLLFDDEKWSSSFQTSYSSLVGRSNSQGAIRKSVEGEFEKLLGIEFSYSSVLAERFQWGVGSSFSRRHESTLSSDSPQTSWGWGDFRLQFGYEALLQNSRLRYFPQTLVYGIGVLPLGQNQYSSKEERAVNVFGSDFFEVGLGLSWVFRWSDTRLNFLTEWLCGIPRNFTISDSEVRITPRSKGRFQVHLGQNFKVAENSFGVFVGVTLEGTESRKSQQELVVVESGPQSLTTFSMGISGDFTEGLQWTISYFDSEWIPPTRSAALRRGLGLGVRYFEFR
jgi:hypothetical protein